MISKDTIIKSLSTFILLLFLFSSAYAQQAVQGTVTSADDGSPLPGVNISVQGTSIGTASATDGTYKIKVPEGSNVLVFSFIGFSKQQVNIAGRKKINVSMKPQAQELEELVVVGYGTQKKSDLTGSVSSVRGDAITSPAVSNPVEAIQGSASGVQVVSSGEPGSSPSINIRGISTTGDSSPLFVVDGVFTNDISYLNNNDVQSIEVLKDASATAIYGSRGANGVVVITTKQGNSDKPQFNLSLKSGVEVPTSYSMVNAQQYATLLNEGLENIGEEPKFDNVGQINNSTDWFDEVMDPAPVNEYNLSFSQGTDNNSYYVSLGYYNQNGVVDKSGYERYSIRVNNQYQLSDNVTLGHNLSGNWSDKDNRLGEAFGWTYRIPSTIPVRNPDGSYASTEIGSNGNVIAAIDNNNNFTKSRALVGNAYIEVGFLNNFQFKSSLGIDLNQAENTQFSPVFFVDNSQKREQNSLSKQWARKQNWLWENTINYKQQFDIHQIDAVVGFTAQENNFETLEGGRNNIFSDNRDLWYLNAGATEGLDNSNIASSSSIVSYLGRLNYTLMDRYLFTGTFRIDGSSKFPDGDRYGTFPSLALGWRIVEEPFMQNVDWLSDLKIRGSWGQIGNQKIGDYRYYATAATGIGYAGLFGGGVNPGATVTTLVNRNVTWEKSEQTDIGLQFALFDNKIEGEVDWYKRTTKDMLVEVGVPGAVGLGATEGNVGSVENSGVELSLDLSGSKNDWTYSVGLRATTIHNEVTDLGPRDELIGGNIGAGKQVTRARVGEPIGYFYGYRSLGPFDTQEEIDNAPAQSGVQPGDLQMVDSNGDGTIGPEDRVKIGSPIPDYTGGLNLTLGFKAIQLSVDMYGSFGNDIYDGNNNVRFSGDDNFSKEWLDRWTGPGTSDEIPRITFGGDWNYETSSRWVHDGSFVKIQNIKLQYSFPASLLETLPISSASIYVTGNNLHYFTKYDGITPELPGSVDDVGDVGEIKNPGDPTNSLLNAGIDSNVYPVSSFYQIGASITF